MNDTTYMIAVAIPGQVYRMVKSRGPLWLKSAVHLWMTRNSVDMPGCTLADGDVLQTINQDMVVVRLYHEKPYGPCQTRYGQYEIRGSSVINIISIDELTDYIHKESGLNRKTWLDYGSE